MEGETELVTIPLSKCFSGENEVSMDSFVIKKNRKTLVLKLKEKHLFLTKN